MQNPETAGSPGARASENRAELPGGKFDVPYIVMKKPSPVINDLQNERGRYHRYVHISKLKPYLEADHTQQLMHDDLTANRGSPVSPTEATSGANGRYGSQSTSRCRTMTR